MLYEIFTNKTKFKYKYFLKQAIVIKKIDLFIQFSIHTTTITNCEIVKIFRY